MNLVIPFLVVLYIVAQAVATSVKKKQQEEQKARQMPQAERAPQTEQARRPAKNVSTPARSRQDSIFPALDDLFPDSGTASGASSRKRAAKPPADDRFPDLAPAPKPGRRVSLPEQSAEGFGTGRSMPEAPDGSAPLKPHVVRPMTEGGHSHTESSITGGAPECPPDDTGAQSAPLTQEQQVQAKADVAYNLPTAVSARRFAFDRGSVTQGFLYGELLAKPKALRR